MSKPYKFIKVLSYKPFDYKNKQKSSGKIKLQIEVVSPLHISSGKITESKAKLYKDFIKYNGKAIIPGTSLKGCVRTIAEAVSYSCAKGFKNEFSEDKYDQLNNCIICQTFGYATDNGAQKSRVIFSDFKMINGRLDYINIPRFFAPNVKGFKDKNDKYKGYKFYYNAAVQETGKVGAEVVTKGSKFEGEVIYNDLTEEQLNLLCFSLGLSGDMYIKLGYGKPGYYGTVVVNAKDKKYEDCAKNYQANATQEIKQNISSLKEIYAKNKTLNSSQWKLVGNTKTY